MKAIERVGRDRVVVRATTVGSGVFSERYELVSQSGDFSSPGRFYIDSVTFSDFISV